jgi:type VI protein secretion system component Hcp
MSDTKSSSDILMKFVYNGVAIEGESSADIAPPNRTPHKMLRGFHKHRMWEIDSFTFSVGVEGATPSAMQGNPQQTGQGMPGAAQGGGWPGNLTREQMAALAQMDPKLMRPSSIGAFKSWRAGGAPKYPVSVQPISFVRGVDHTSISLMHHCIKSRSFDSATLVKRKAAGGAIAGEPYLRLDFTGVLVTNISWSNDDPVQETCKFISRAITVQYRPQLPDGTLGAILHGFWSMNASERETIL